MPGPMMRTLLEAKPKTGIVDRSYFSWPIRLYFEDGDSGIGGVQENDQHAAPSLQNDLPQKTTTQVEVKKSKVRRKKGVFARNAQLGVGGDDVPTLGKAQGTHEARGGRQKPGRHAAGKSPLLQGTSGMHAQTLVYPTPPLARSDNPSEPLTTLPLSVEDRLSSELYAYQLVRTYSLVPSFRGEEETWHWHYYDSLAVGVRHHKCLELTCRAYLAATHCRRGTVTLRSCYAALAHAIDGLQATLEVEHSKGVSDSVMQSVVLLSAVEAEKGDSNLLNASHVEGLTFTLASRATGTPTDVSRSILDHFSFDIMTSCIARGVVSPLEKLNREHFDYRSTDPMAKLTALRIEICIRIPRLVTLTRAVLAEHKKRDGKVAISMLHQRALMLARELYYLRDIVAEASLRRDVECTGSAWFTKRHWTFSSPSAWEAVSTYWHVRFLVLRLCQTLFFNGIVGAGEPAALRLKGTVFLRSMLEAELLETGQCLLMSKNLCESFRPNRDRLRAQSFILLWGALPSMPKIDIEVESDQACEDRAYVLRSRLLESTIQLLQAPQIFFLDTDMDEAAAMLTGGPVRGGYARLYGLKAFG
ncbi:hypothetical protein LTR10_003207 [Elasticomyces elasticus]|nr:hypothetical protein LTR10_003207 [Elasticomyces elasticus]KAK4969479.1 hypothetical protein LTR42_008749 [Elasticomyces elasticus]